MEFTMGRDRFFITRQEEQHGVGSGSSSTAPFGRDGGGGNWLAEKEHMFDKVVTPSDVGKLNRLVIPKQYAERYFPLDSAANEKGLLLSFEDRSGKSWRFRYSYWNSSQSYVMTKGWSRFVKEKRLDAGDTVSFSRGIGEAARGHLYIDWMRRSDAHDPARGHLYIDWMRRSDAHDPARFPRIPVQGFSFGRAPPVAPWASHHFFMPPAVAATAAYDLHRQGPILFFRSPVAGPSPVEVQPRGSGVVSEVVESMPAVDSQAAAKRVRLFGVNLFCSESEGDGSTTSEGASLSLLHSQPTLQSRYESSPSMSKEQDSSLDLDL